MLPFPFSPRRERNGRKRPEVKDRCAACESPLDPKHQNHVIYEASNYMTLTVEDAMTYPREIEYWELSVVQVGPECAKKLKGHVMTSEAALSAVAKSRADFEVWRKTWPTVERWAIGHGNYVTDWAHRTRENAEAAAKAQTEWSSNRKISEVFHGPVEWHAVGPMEVQVRPKDVGKGND